ncbi:hypothetical protein [Streptomyces sp. NPDC001933]|uniref:hypothetical protein n=1 Tax=Streptomyces sp. NPDC001933 TaxID=3364626 RepID=UPI0036935D36
MKKPRKLYTAVGIALGIAFNALAVSDFTAGDSGNALHELLNAVLSWTASSVLVVLEHSDHDQRGHDG